MKLTLRDLFWLILVVALALGWGVYSSRMTGSVHQLERENESYRSHIDSLHVQLEREGYTIIDSSIGPFLGKNDTPYRHQRSRGFTIGSERKGRRFN